jgi:hypothetical protein
MSGDGHFYIKITNSKTNKIGYSISLRVIITQHVKDQLLMNSILKNLKCGYINKQFNINAIDFKVTSFNDIYNIIIPFFNQYQIEGIKSNDFQDFCKVAELINKKEHLTKEGLGKIREIKFQMNKGRLIK